MRSKDVDEDHVEEHVRSFTVSLVLRIDQKYLDDEGEGDSRFSVGRGPPRRTRGETKEGRS